ncbi:efflux RND transporter permease subunit [Gallaecimonas xiamenensis]|uniref:AcrB/AcrD/AcrF family transporter n=1 Tax=Gallaecimonas xiamenensis 3-C-1 TaxID=745411 RepID=K2K4P2_9GAMM|nr:efflux RND transporter permease subunit [Gallaecimonas xiamenensis]EKE77919.1 AcrB/AcrD/AcrF family transporter [Gallaecimonas xiamenensis 3-C-1]
MGIAEYAIRHKVVSWLFTLVLLVGGIVSFFRLGQLEDPEFTIKSAMIIAQYPGASPQQVEEELTLPIEQALQNLPYVDYLTSISSQGLAQVTVEMKPKYRKKALAQIWDEVRRKMHDLQGSLPPGTGQIMVKDDYADVYGMLFALTGDGYSYQDLKDQADYLRRELVLVKGVGKVQLGGVQQEQVFVEISRAKLAALGISLQRILQLLSTQNSVNPGGHIRVGDEYVRIYPTGEFQSVSDMGQLLISEPGDDQLVYLADVAQISRAFAEVPSQLYRFNGQPALTLGISFTSGVNVVDVGRAVDKRLVELDYQRPVGMALATIYHQPREVDKSVTDFLVNLGEAVLIVIVVLLLFMGLRSGILMGLVLLLTILGTFIVMRMLAIDLQRISLGALIIALGMLVDNAIVVTEGVLIGIQRGQTRVQAAANIVNQTKWPLLGATVIAIAAFAPIGLSEDATGEYCGTLFSVLLISLFLSWITAITLTPFYCYLFFKEGQGQGTEPQDPYKGAFYQGYKGFLLLCVRHRVLTLLAMLALLVGALAGFGKVKQAFFPPSNTPMFLVDYWLPQGSDIRATRDAVARLEGQLLAIDGVAQVTSTVGQGAQRFMLTYSPEKQYGSYGQLLVKVTDLDAMGAVVDQTRDLLEQTHPAAFAKVKRMMIGPSPKASIEARFSGPDPKTLRQLASQAEALLNQTPGVSDVRHDWRQPEKVIRPQFAEAQARRAGISRQDLDDVLAMNFSGKTVGLYRDGSQLLPIMVRPPASERLEADNLQNVQVWSPVFNRYLPINQVVSDFKTEWEDALLMRRDRKRTITVEAEPALDGDETAAQLLARVRPAIEGIALPPGYELEWGGEYEKSHDAQQSLFSSLPLGYLFMFIITIFLFDSVRQPLVIWLTVPLALIGVTTGLLLMNAPFGFMALLGFLSLTGMLIKNGIVLVEQIKLEFEQGRQGLDAVVEAAVSRVRPVCMAAATTILGMIPLLFDAFFESMAVVIMFGLGFATVLTLIVVPVLYTLFYRIPAKG